ncbi:MAG: NAD(P)H-dependent oxidoreductase subunit E [Spirochaetaceae bacterium]|nr:NAD(P)H-dependent oxidoreductase subunit E [Spirochaetaceae bacterium]
MPTAAAQAQVDDLPKIIQNNLDKPGNLLKILEQAQESDPKHYLSEKTLRTVADTLGLPLTQVYSVVTFYSFFNLKPQGKHSIVVCRGTACHTRGSLALLNEALHNMGIKSFKEEEENSVTSLDGFASVRTVACFGQCALAPVIQIDGVVKSRMTIGKLVSLLEKMKKEAKNERKN